MPNPVPRLSGDAPSADILTDAIGASGRSQVRFARDVLGVNDRSLRGWLAGEPCWPPVVRLAWLVAQHPELADELDAEFRERE